MLNVTSPVVPDDDEPDVTTAMPDSPVAGQPVLNTMLPLVAEPPAVLVRTVTGPEVVPAVPPLPLLNTTGPPKLATVWPEAPPCSRIDPPLPPLLVPPCTTKGDAEPGDGPTFMTTEPGFADDPTDSCGGSQGGGARIRQTRVNSAAVSATTKENNAQLVRHVVEMFRAPFHGSQDCNGEGCQDSGALTKIPPDDCAASATLPVFMVIVAVGPLDTGRVAVWMDSSVLPVTDALPVTDDIAKLFVPTKFMREICVRPGDTSTLPVMYGSSSPVSTPVNMDTGQHRSS